MSSLKAKLGSIQQVAEKRILRLERALPILVDFAEDRVYFRGLNIALFALVLLFIIRAGLFIVFLQFPLVQKTNQALNLEGKLGPSVYFGGSFDDPVKVHVTKTSRRIPVIGRNKWMCLICYKIKRISSINHSFFLIIFLHLSTTTFIKKTFTTNSYS